MVTENLPDPEVAARGIQEQPWSVTRGGLGGPNTVWLNIGNQGFRLHIEHDPEYPERGKWYEQKLRDAMTKLVTSCNSNEASAHIVKERDDGRLPVVGGERMDRTIAAFVRGCRVLLREEQEKIAPDNALVSILCDAVRLTREYERLARESDEDVDPEEQL